MPEPSPEHLKRQVIRLVHARVDILCAAALAEELLQVSEQDISYRAWGLLTGMVVSYARPFTTSYAYGALEEKWSKFDQRPDLEKHHARLLDHRKTLLAHNDLSPHRAVVVFPTGFVLESGEVVRRAVPTEGRSPIALEGIREVSELFAIQEERMMERCLDLVRRLEEVEGWDPQEMVELNLDADV
jgi:hypothetical protein